MKKTISVHKKQRGRPATGQDPLVSARAPVTVVTAIEAWAAKHDTTRSEAIRRLIELGLSPSAKIIKTTAGPPKEGEAQDRPPPGWGTDELSKFWEAGRQNQFATFVRKEHAYSGLARIDEAFCIISKDWLNPIDEIAALLLLRTHSAFRAAAGLAATGQATEAYVLNRSVLENAAYALHLNKNHSLKKVWLNRHVDAASLEACARALSHRKVQKTVAVANRHAGERFEKLYQQTIDFGGHPNERAVTGNVKIYKQPARRVMLSVLQHGDGVQLDAILKATARCGFCSLEILQGVFNARFELLGVNAAMLNLRQGL